MKIINLSLPLWWSVFAISAVSNVADDIRLGEPAYGGSGCPAGSAAIVIAPDGNFVGMLFDEFSAEVYEFDARRLQRKSCNVAIPVSVPPGFSVKPNAMEFTGVYDVTMNNYVRFNVESFFAGTMGPTFVHQIQSDDEHGQFALRNDSMPDAVAWSPCGQDVILRLNISVLASARAILGRAAIAVEKMLPIDDAGGALLVRRCEQ